MKASLTIRIGPKLLGIPESALTEPIDDSWKELPIHPEEEQIKLDVARSFVFYPTFETDNEMEIYRADLSDVIIYVLRRNPLLSYYQGYHDVTQVLLLVLGKSLAMPVLEHLSLFFLRDFMLPTMDGSIDHLKLIPYIISSADESLGKLLSHVNPIYAISSVLTIFSHDIESFDNICIIFDYVFASGSMIVPLYLYASLIISRKDELEALQTTDCDILHSTLSKIPSPISDLSLFDVTARASTLLELYPPQFLKNWDSISKFSVLKTTAAPKSPGRRYSAVHDFDRVQRFRKNSARSRLSSSCSADIEEPCFAVSEDPILSVSEHESDKAKEDSFLDSMSTTRTMSDSMSIGSLTSPLSSTQSTSFTGSCVTVSDTDDESVNQFEEKDADIFLNSRRPMRQYSMVESTELLNFQVDESKRKAEEAKQRQLEKKILEERRRLETARKAEEETSKSAPVGRSKFQSTASALGLVSSARIAEVFPSITKGSGALVYHLTRNLKAGTRVLMPTSIAGVSIYVGLFSVLAYAWYYNQTYYYHGGLLRWLDFRIVWQKMVARYFQ